MNAKVGMIVVCIFGAIILALLLLYPSYDVMPKQKSSIIMLIQALGRAHEAGSRYWEDNKSLDGIELTESNYLNANLDKKKYLHVLHGGGLLGIDFEANTFVVLMPYINDHGDLVWHCDSYPKESSLVACR